MSASLRAVVGNGTATPGTATPGTATLGLAALGVIALGVAGLASTPARADADAILINGKIITVDKDFSTKQALAIRDGKVLATGPTADIQKLATPATKVIDLGGRTVIPGLTDAHLHGVRAALTFSIEVNWIGVTSIEEALSRLKAAAVTAGPGAWLIVAGGWMDIQFKEKRKPTQAEIMAAAPGHPVYLQQLYEWVLLSPEAMKQLNINSEADVPASGKLVLGADGKPNGEITGSAITMTQLFNKLPRPTFAQEKEGSRLFYRELNRLGLTGFIDPAGVSVFPASYRPSTELWKEGKLTVRLAYHISSQQPGKEFEDYKSQTQLLPSGFGDDMLKFNGLGEIVTWASWTDGDPTPEAFAKLREVVRWAAQNRMGFEIHWNPERTVGSLLDIFEETNKDFPITELRWAINHLHDVSEGSLKRMKALGLGWSVQDSLYFSGARFKQVFGVAISERSPPIKTALDLGVMVGAGTDAHRVSSYNPFVSLRWYLDGRTIDGGTSFSEKERPTREQALRMYTLNSAWFANDDKKRGSLEPGKYADLAVLTKDYMTAPMEEISGIESLLTMLGGKVVYGAGPFAPLEEK